MEFSAPGIILTTAAYGEGDALASIFTEEHGVYRGLARGGASRKHAAIWQQGNLVEARWVARLADQLGAYTAELIHPAAALAMDDAWSLAILRSLCAVTEGALPEREPHPRIFRAALHLIAHIGEGEALLPDYIRYEAGLLEELGYGLDLTTCAVTGTREDLAYVSPRTGRAVSEHAAGTFKSRLLPLPAFLKSSDTPTLTSDDAEAGLRLTGHFLARDLFGTRHKGIPASRIALEDRLASARPKPDISA